MATGRRKNDLVTTEDFGVILTKVDELKDLSARLDERVASAVKVIDRLQDTVEDIPWEKNSERIKTVERFTWAAVIASIGATIKAFWL